MRGVYFYLGRIFVAGALIGLSIYIVLETLVLVFNQ